MKPGIRNLLGLLGFFSLALGSDLAAQQPDDDPKRRSLTRLKTFAVHARVRVSHQATLERIDESLLRTRLELAMRQEGISVQGPGDVRDGSQAEISLEYLVLETGSGTGGQTGFAASSCLQASQLVTIPRLGAYHYTTASTWSSCGMIVGGRDSFRASILHNADQQIARFLSEWRKVNPAVDRSDNRAVGRTGGRAGGDRAVGRSGGQAVGLTDTTMSVILSEAKEPSLVRQDQLFVGPDLSAPSLRSG